MHISLIKERHCSKWVGLLICRSLTVGEVVLRVNCCCSVHLGLHFLPPLATIEAEVARLIGTMFMNFKWETAKPRNLFPMKSPAKSRSGRCQGPNGHDHDAYVFFGDLALLWHCVHLLAAISMLSSIRGRRMYSLLVFHAHNTRELGVYVWHENSSQIGWYNLIIP